VRVEEAVKLRDWDRTPTQDDVTQGDGRYIRERAETVGEDEEWKTQIAMVVLGGEIRRRRDSW
jgi:hypothetical protein